jgi:hypothetical protein
MRPIAGGVLRSTGPERGRLRNSFAPSPAARYGQLCRTGIRVVPVEQVAYLNGGVKGIVTLARW